MTPLPRKSPMRKVRKAARPGRLKGEALRQLRVECWIRDAGYCQDCGRPTLFGAPHLWANSYHMAHIKAKRIGGDALPNVRTLCGDCHRREHAYGKSMTKPCPPKTAAVPEDTEAV